MPESLLSRMPKPLVVLAISIASMVPLQPAAAQTPEEGMRELHRQVEELMAMILDLRSEVAASRAETAQMRIELRSALQGGARPLALAADTTGGVQAEEREATVEQRVTELEENQRLVTARLEEQYQTKVESASRYRTRLSGIVLLNGFFNRGLVDSQEVPRLAAAYGPTDAREAVGFSVLQSQLGFETFGPTLAGARVSAGLQFDFFGTSSDPTYGISYGGVRLRTAIARMDWERTSLVVGQDVPFLSPGSPTSVASLAYPAFSHAGNLWVWSPQARVEHRFGEARNGSWLVQAGVFAPLRRGSPQPGYGTRVAWSKGEEAAPVTLGVGAYYNREDRGYGRTHDGWAGTLDWRVPLGQRVGLSGEFYRGRGVGALGAAQGRSLIFDGEESDPASSMTGLDVTGGWSQLTFRPTPAVEFNLAHGEDHAYGRDLRLFPSYAPAVSRNRAEMVNFIYRPRTDLIFSLEYRHLATRRVDADDETAGHVNVGIGVLF